MTVSNIVGPFLVYLDRFLIGALISMSAVAYYATPYEAITRLWFVPAAFSGVLFPAFSALTAEPVQLSRLFGRGLKYVGIALFPAILIVCTLAGDGLRLWLGPEFSAHSTKVLQLLAAGVFVNSMAQVSFALLQSQGRPDITAKLHLVELLPYAAAVWLMVRHFGVVGAAVAWTARVVADAALLFWFSGRFIPPLRSTISRALASIAGAGVLFAIGASLHTPAMKAVFLITAAVAYVACAWGYFFSRDERAWITGIALRYLRT
jgi:O-antigen/teichoic acid export membrane protein